MTKGSTILARRVTLALVAGLLLLATATTVTAQWRRTPRPTRLTPDAMITSSDHFSAVGTVRPAEIDAGEHAEAAVPVIGGPETIPPKAEEAPYPSELPATTSAATPTTSPTSARPPSSSTQRPNVGQTTNTTNSSSAAHPAPPASPTSTPTSTSAPPPPPPSPSPSSSPPTPTSTPRSMTMQTPSPPVSPMPTKATPTTVETETPHFPSTTPPTWTERISSPPQPQIPQAVEPTLSRAQKTWPLLVFVGGIVAAAGVIVLVLWRDTRVSKQRASRDRSMSAHNKTASGDLEFDWYASSPNLSSIDDGVDTFMGRKPPRPQSEPHVSSRAASTVDLLDISTVGDRSSRSNRTNRSDAIQEHDASEANVHHPTYAAMNPSREDVPRQRNESTERSGSSPRVSFDDEVNALSEWSGSEMDASVQAIFDEHHRAFFQSQTDTALYAAGGDAAFSPTSTDGRDDVESDDSDSCSCDDSCEEEEQEHASERRSRRFSNGSTYSAVPSFSTAILGECSFVSSASSVWSDLTVAASDRGSRQSLDSWDEPL